MTVLQTGQDIKLSILSVIFSIENVGDTPKIPEYAHFNQRASQDTTMGAAVAPR